MLDERRLGGLHGVFSVQRIDLGDQVAGLHVVAQRNAERLDAARNFGADTDQRARLDHARSQHGLLDQCRGSHGWWRECVSLAGALNTTQPAPAGGEDREARR